LRLTPRQLDVLERAGAGLSDHETAAELYISVTTVKTHKRNLLEKLGARNATHAIALAYDAGELPRGELRRTLAHMQDAEDALKAVASAYCAGTEPNGHELDTRLREAVARIQCALRLLKERLQTDEVVDRDLARKHARQSHRDLVRTVDDAASACWQYGHGPMRTFLSVTRRPGPKTRLSNQSRPHASHTTGIAMPDGVSRHSDPEATDDARGNVPPCGDHVAGQPQRARRVLRSSLLPLEVLVILRWS
jgi:DNA-binding CsgD family transcriptional regulator